MICLPSSIATRARPGFPARMWRLPLVVVIFVVQGVSCLKLSNVDVPPHPVAGSSVPLRCVFDMEGDELYSVKWYKTNAEFYRYLPKDNPPAQVYEVEGVSVDLSQSGQNVVTLENVSLKSSGLYRCEVSAEAPSFVTNHLEGEMNVIALPLEEPKITGGRTNYRIGDTVQVNCTSFRSKPAAMLAWTINSSKAPRQYLKEYQVVSQDGLETSILGLKFQITEGHFKEGDLKFKCTATIAPIYHQSTEEIVSAGSFNVLPIVTNDTPSPVPANRKNSGCSSVSSTWWSTAILGFMLRLLQG